jgi:hypothetical protein
MAAFLLAVGALLCGVRADPAMTYLTTKAECIRFLVDSKQPSLLGSFEKEYKNPLTHRLFLRLDDFAKKHQDQYPVAFIDERSEGGCPDVFEAVNVNTTFDATLFGKRHKPGRNVIYVVRDGRTSSFRPTELKPYDRNQMDLFTKHLDEAFKDAHDEKEL